MVKFYIANKDGKFVKAEGYMAGTDYVIHKAEKGDWRISDMSSGMMVKGGLKTYKAAREAFATMPDFVKEEIKKIKATEQYKKACEKVAAYAKEFGL